MSQPSPVSGLTMPQAMYPVFHHYKKELVHTALVGVYPNLEMAKSAASIALQNELTRYRQAGMSGKFCEEIDLVLKGLITVITENGEMPVSEFEICEEQMISLNGTPSDRTLLNGTPPTPPPPLHTPSIDSVVVSQSDDANHGYPEERDPHWAQSRLPIFRKRDERMVPGMETHTNRNDFVLRRSECNSLVARPATSSQSTVIPSQLESAPPMTDSLDDIVAADDEHSDIQVPAPKLQAGKVKILKR